MVRGQLQRNYHVCIRRVTRPQAYWPYQQDHRRTGRANTRRRNITTGGLLETRAAMAERAAILPRTVRLAPGTSSRCEGSDRIGWYTVL